MRVAEGEMSRIMMEMHDEMMPMHLPEGKTMSHDMHEKMNAAMKLKLRPGMQEGEVDGSLHDAMMKVMPDMKMDTQGMKPGQVSRQMVEMMLKGWREKHGALPDIDPMPMDSEPQPATRASAK